MIILISIKNAKIVAISIFIILILSIAVFFLKEFIANYFVRLTMDDIPSTDSNTRLLVFAPHNDDEVLGAAQLIKNTLSNHGQVKVVMMTNGDGFKSALEFDYLKLNPKPKDYIKFGYNRQKETLAALKSLGLAEKDVIFLGYPDGGLAAMWTLNWDSDNAYSSIYTQTNKSPYSNSMTSNASFSGTSVINDINIIINKFKPTHIAYPHPNDRHPDHWATNAFIKTVLAKSSYKPQKEWLYLVHRGDWPTPMKKSPKMFLTPPNKLVGIGTHWYSLDLSDNDIYQKTQAIHMYKTQLRTLGVLLTAFERKSELFGEYPNLNIVKGLNNDSSISATTLNRIIADPIKDTLGLEINRNTDIVNVYGEISKEGNLHFFIETDSEIEKNIQYHLSLVLVDGSTIHHMNLISNGIYINENYNSKDSITKIDGVKASQSGKTLHLVIPGIIVGHFDYIFVNSQSSVEDNLLDRTAWRMCY